MTRLIDADELAEIINWTFAKPPFSRKTVQKMIDMARTIDAVPVIRCYECKYFMEFEKGFSSDWDGSCRYWNTHSTVYSNFCGCGARMYERKEE